LHLEGALFYQVTDDSPALVTLWQDASRSGSATHSLLVPMRNIDQFALKAFAYLA
jgi:hypothetical protein